MVYKVILVKIDQRSSEATKVQDILTKYGCNIRVRLGLHEVSNEFCANDGLVVLEVQGDRDILDKMIEELNALEYVQAKLVEM
ncbi:MAG TPA: hypothetical protein P5518_02465 [Candidatus Cloacimonas sp.]|jgi:hypothetical protein|nr:hypothetical protein [Candidatus Cloacimonas sp.]MDD2249939.1 hypothetical protein [Candidatus Cloacimonadota bacterium]MCK9158373.1 hypothetical protein [Candidatus Cloacimonas sp.]MCK9164359.1 hypothetical protein [Candidatus Cloacimonas sp.]MDD3733731.1 hypothetical protein [Candidatus Cloacimonadota bacterium]